VPLRVWNVRPLRYLCAIQVAVYAMSLSSVKRGPTLCVCVCVCVYVRLTVRDLANFKMRQPRPDLGR